MWMEGVQLIYGGTTPPAFPSFLHGLRIINGIDDKEIVGHPSVFEL